MPAEPLGVFIRNSWRSLLIAANMNTQQHIPGGDQDSEIDNSFIIHLTELYIQDYTSVATSSVWQEWLKHDDRRTSTRLAEEVERQVLGQQP